MSPLYFSLSVQVIFSITLEVKEPAPTVHISMYAPEFNISV